MRFHQLVNLIRNLTIVGTLIGITACGSATGGTTSNGGSTSFSNSNSSSVTSLICDKVTGLEAIYWDFSNGVPRGDLPATANTIPSNFTANFAHPTILSFFFWYPPEWVVDSVLADNFGSYGVNLIRDDQKAVWRSATTQVASGSTAASILQGEIDAILNFIGNPTNVETVCDLQVQEPNFAGGTTDAASAFMRLGDFTANITVRITNVPISAGNVFAQAAVYMVLSPTDEYAQLVYDVFVPIITQFYGGGSSVDSDKACSDGKDNDNDGFTDFPNDSECSSADDDSESVL